MMTILNYKKQHRHNNGGRRKQTFSKQSSAQKNERRNEGKIKTLSNVRLEHVWANTITHWNPSLECRSSGNVQAHHPPYHHRHHHFSLSFWHSPWFETQTLTMTIIILIIIHIIHLTLVFHSSSPLVFLAAVALYGKSKADQVNQTSNPKSNTLVENLLAGNQNDE